MPRDTRLTLWPEQVAFFPLASSWGAIKNTKALDFSYCVQVRSCGLASSALILNWLFQRLASKKMHRERPRRNSPKRNQLSLLSLVGLSEENFSEARTAKPQRLIETVFENDNTVIMDACKRLGFFESIDDFLCDTIKLRYNVGKKRLSPIQMSNTDTSYPIFRLRHECYKISKREMVDDFLSYSFPIFDAFFKKNPEKGNQLNHVLEEIVKNIADHAQADGLVGIDTTEEEGRRTISIMIGDAGPGIYEHMRENYVLFKEKRGRFTGLAEVYRYALEDEVSGSGGPDNYGCGMSTIINNCIAIDAGLSVFDESTRLVLTSLSPIVKKGPSHNEIWRVSFRFDGQKPFFYFIQCEDR